MGLQPKMRLFQHNRARHAMSGRGSTILSQEVVFHSLSHRQLFYQPRFLVSVGAVSLWSWSIHGFTHSQLLSSPFPPQLQETQQGAGTACRTQSWMPPQGSEGMGASLVGQGGEETPRIQRSLWKREQLQRAAVTAAAHNYLLLPDTALQVLDVY